MATKPKKVEECEQAVADAENEEDLAKTHYFTAFPGQTQRAFLKKAKAAGAELAAGSGLAGSESVRAPE